MGAYRPVEGRDYMIDFYAFIGVDRTSSTDVIRHRIHALEHQNNVHRLEGMASDLRDIARRRLELLVRAAAILLDAQARAAYDAALAAWEGEISTDGTPIYDPRRFRPGMLEDFVLSHVLDPRNDGTKDVERAMTYAHALNPVHNSERFPRLFARVRSGKAGEKTIADCLEACDALDAELAAEEYAWGEVIGAPASSDPTGETDHMESVNSRLAPMRAAAGGMAERVALEGGTTLLMLTGRDGAERTLTGRELAPMVEVAVGRVSEILDHLVDLARRREELRTHLQFIRDAGVALVTARYVADTDRPPRSRVILRVVANGVGQNVAFDIAETDDAVNISRAADPPELDVAHRPSVARRCHSEGYSVMVLNIRLHLPAMDQIEKVLTDHHAHIVEHERPSISPPTPATARTLE